MEDIAAWLGKWLDEDERFARAASGTLGIVRPWYEAQGLRKAMPGMQRADCLFIARHDPARVLREVAAKRRILAEHEHVTATEPSTHGFGCKICAYDRGDCVQYGWGWCNTVRLLTDAYADRDGYNPVWRVE